MKIRLNQISIFPFKESYHICINDTIGSWCVLDNYEYDEFQRLNCNTNNNEEICEKVINTSLLCKLFKNNIISIDNQQFIIEKEIQESSYPFSFIIKTTNNCNLSCKYCYTKTAKIKDNDFDLRLIMETLNKIRSLIGNDRHIIITFHGGEPLLKQSQVMGAIEIIEQTFNNVSFSIQTNGILLNKSIIKFCENHSVKIGVSIDGFTLQENQGRFNNSGEKLLRILKNNICELVDSKVNFGLLSVINVNNVNSIVDSMESFIDIGVRNFVLNPLLQIEPQSINLYNDKLGECYMNLIKFIQEKNSTICDSHKYISERSCSTIIRAMFLLKHYQCFNRPCGAGENCIAIDTDGGLYPCDVFFNNPEFAVGNIDKLNRLSESKAIRLFSSMSLKDIDECSTCVFRHLCTFWCPADSLYIHHDFKHKHSLCSLSKRIIPELMVMIANKKLNPDFFI